MCGNTAVLSSPKHCSNHFFSLNGDLQRAIDCVRGLRQNGKMGRIPTPTHCATTADLDFLVLEMFSFSFQSCWQWWHTYTNPLASHDMVQCRGGLWWRQLHVALKHSCRISSFTRTKSMILVTWSLISFHLQSICSPISTSDWQHSSKGSRICNMRKLLINILIVTKEKKFHLSHPQSFTCTLTISQWHTQQLKGKYESI